MGVRHPLNPLSKKRVDQSARPISFSRTIFARLENIENPEARKMGQQQKFGFRWREKLCRSQNYSSIQNFIYLYFAVGMLTLATRHSQADPIIGIIDLKASRLWFLKQFFNLRNAIFLLRQTQARDISRSIYLTNFFSFLPSRVLRVIGCRSTQSGIVWDSSSDARFQLMLCGKPKGISTGGFRLLVFGASVYILDVYLKYFLRYSLKINKGI